MYLKFIPKVYSVAEIIFSSDSQEIGKNEKFF